MKQILFALVLLTAIATMASAQSPFTPLSFDEACKKAKADNKIVLLLIESPACTPCNITAMQGLLSWQAKKAIDKNCIALRSNKLPAVFTNPANLYVLPASFGGVLLLDGNENILEVLRGGTTSGDFYAEKIEKAVWQKESPGPNLTSLKKEYYGGNADCSVMKLLVEAIRKLNMEPSQELLDDLVQKAPKDSAASLSFLQFILRAAPLVGSVAQQYTEKNRDTYNMAWYRMELPERASINNKIIGKSEAKAIADKDQGYAYRVAGFAQMVNQANPENAQRAYQWTLLQYYKGVKDTSTYIRTALTYYDQFYMKERVDDVKVSDSLARLKLFKEHPLVPDPVQPDMASRLVSSTQLNPRAMYFSSALNEGAWFFYLYTANPQHLAKALTWAKRATEFQESPEAIDTYARLLYKTGNKEAAITWEAKADMLSRARIPALNEYGKVLEKMKAGATLIDP